MYSGYVEPEEIDKSEELNSQIEQLDDRRNEIENQIEQLNEEWQDVTDQIQELYNG